jgi:integrase
MPSLSRTFDLKADAEAWAREVEREAQRGNIAALNDQAQRVTVAELCQRYRATVLPTLRDASRPTLLRNIEGRFGAFFLGNVRSIDVAAWRDDLIREGYAPKSAKHHMVALSSLFSFAERELSIPLPAGNPVRTVRKPAEPKARDRRLRPGELDYLLKGADQGRAVGLRQVITLAIESSMRMGELLGLEWSRVDLQKRTAHLVDTKNGESRTVALSSVAVAALQALPRRIDGKVFSWKSNKENGSFEKLWQRCKARGLAAYQADCEKAAKRSDPAFLAGLHFHDLRHEATSRLFEKGLGVMEVASMTGHKSLSMLKRYTHIEAEKLAKKLG